MSLLPVLQLGPVHADVGRALDWLTGLGAAPCAPLTLALPPLLDVRRYAAQGGMVDGPFGSRGLVRAALATLGPAELDRLAAAPERVVFITPPGFHPHTWGPDGGGVHLGRGRWVRRYAILPHGAPWGHVAHELGHLLHAWPDLDAVGGLRCLMSRGADRAGGQDPVAPCAALRIDAGWAEAVPIDDYAGAGCFREEIGGLTLVGEERDGALDLQLLHGALPHRAATLPPDDRPLRSRIAPTVGLWLAEARRRAEARRAVAGRV